MSGNKANQTFNGAIENYIDPPGRLVVKSPVGERISIKDLPPEVLTVVSTGVTDWHPKLGRCTALDGEAIIILPVHAKLQTLPLLDEGFTQAPDLVIETELSYLGSGALVYTPILEGILDPAAICHMPNPFFAALSSQLITVIYHRKSKPIAAFKYDLSRDSELAQSLEKILYLLVKYSAGEFFAAFNYLTLKGFSSTINYRLSSSEKFSASWAHVLGNLLEEWDADHLVGYRYDFIEEILEASPKELPPSVLLILEALLQSRQWSRSRAYSHIQQAISPTNITEIARFISNLTESKEREDAHKEILRPIDDCLRLFLWNAEQTMCGLRLPWLTEKGELKYLDLDPDSMREPSIYWYSVADLTYDGPLLELGRMIQANDTPINPHPEPEEISLDIFPRVVNVNEARQEMKQFLEEAAAAKQWTIPPGAIVQGPFGPISTLEFFESPYAVYGTVRDHEGKFLPFFVSPERDEVEIRGYPWIRFPVDYPAPIGFDSHDDFIKNTKAALGLLIAAIIRDFWVVEYRERVFRVKSQKRFLRADSQRPELRVVYLPRIKYFSVQTPKASHVQREVSTRSAHKVRGHLRRADSASPAQRALARRYGFILPAGFTFVSPHWRGHQQRQVVYRSRSALNALYTRVETEKQSFRPLWFQFELDVKDLLESLGFQTEHASATKQGDDGVDVFATRKRQGVLEHWLVQCKCYSPKNTVGPKIVRELIGSIADEKEGIEPRGMIVTTSSLTSGAKKLAEKHGIQWIEGEPFQSMLSKIRDGKKK